jgi:flagellar basal-body rod protein FlgG
MPIPYQIAVDALQAESARVEMISNNLVNAASAGFKRGLLTSSPFADNLAELASRAGINRATPLSVDSVATDFSQGTMTDTGDLNHIAIVGPGFFEMRSGTQVMYTRAGAFRRDDRGRLVNSQGYALQGDGGDIMIKSDKFRIERDGMVTDGDRAVARLQLMDFSNKAALQRVGASNFDALGQGGFSVKSPSVRQGFLEASNVSSSTEMVQLMEAVKRFEFGQRIVQSQDDMIDRAIRRIGESQ